MNEKTKPFIDDIFKVSNTFLLFLGCPIQWALQLPMISSKVCVAIAIPLVCQGTLKPDSQQTPPRTQDYGH